MIGGKEGESIELNPQLIKKACSLSIKAHLKSPEKPYLQEKIHSSKEVVFAFPGSWDVNDWYSKQPFGVTKIDTCLFPSLKSVGTDEIALVNEVFSSRFEELLSRSPLEREVEKAISEKKQIVFAGHLSGGPIAILAALWFLEKHKKLSPYSTSPLCLTFGSPLMGDRIFSQALRRENWARCFYHFIMRYDIVPRIMLAPLSSIQPGLQLVLPYMNPRSQYFQHETVPKSSDAMSFFMMVMRNASCVTSHSACHLMGCSNLMLETVSNFVELSPYRPFGTYIFCSGDGKLVAVENSEAVLQLLFYSAQLSSQAEIHDVVQRSLTAHIAYETELQSILAMQDVVFLNSLAHLPLSLENCINNEEATLDSVLNNLGLSTKARLCIRAAGEMEKQKLKNQEKVDSNKDCIRDGLNKIQEYQTKCDARRLGYYDTFKLQKDVNDFNTNVKRLELAGIWDEIVEMLQRHELPDGFEGRKEWIELGTRYRRLVEPLDIANYYRHLKNEDTGPYTLSARPKRYRFTQRWLEHAERTPAGMSSESCFWAEVEELKANPFENVKERILGLEQHASKWILEGKLNKDVFFEESTFTKWWKTLPQEHRFGSCIAEYISKN